MEKRTARLLGFAVIVAACASAARAADEGYFVRQGTWLETIVASRDALSAREAKAEREYAGGKHAFQAVEVKVNGQDRPKPVRIRVAGLQRIYISCESDRQVFLTEFKQVDKHGDALAMAVSKARSLPLAKGGRARIQPRGGRRGDRQSALGSAVLMRAEVALDLAPKAETLEVTIGVTDGKSASLVVRFDRRSEGELSAPDGHFLQRTSRLGQLHLLLQDLLPPLNGHGLQARLRLRPSPLPRRLPRCRRPSLLAQVRLRLLIGQHGL